MNWSRREFLSASAVAPLIAIETRAAAPFSERERAILLAAMNEIIPASDGMPAASDAGGIAYLERVAAADGNVASELREAIAALNRSSEASFQRRFDQLDHATRVSALKDLEQESPIELAHLRDYVYESYYTQPAVWKLIGYEFYPTNRPGPHMKPFDDSILENVRKMSPLYREA